MRPLADLKAAGSRGRPLTLLLTAIAIVLGAFAAIHSAWLSDDAFISFRYARHLAGGLGLVYNAGERVEGYSNFLWTVWLAFGMRLGFGPETWSNAWSIASYAGAIALLGAHRVRIDATDARGGGSGTALVIPVAALGAALHPDWARFATSGLETSPFTCLLVLGWVLLARDEVQPRHAAGAGYALALAALTRPEGVLFAALGAAYLLWRGRPRLGSLLVFAGIFCLAWAPHVVWRIAYYGEYYPNTYYAKSAAIAWWSQGWIYVRYFFMRSIVLAAALPVAALVALAWSPPAAAPDGPAPARTAGDPRGPMVLAAAFALGLTVFVMRVGGDFMFARLLVPAIPFYLLLLEYAIVGIARGSAPVAGVASAAALALIVLVPYPFRPGSTVNGIVHEWTFYPGSKIDEAKHEGEVLRRYFKGLPVRVAFVGGQAMLMYYADPAVAIESQTGLTDRWIAHQPLTRRGRVGHEKLAPLAYLLEIRHVNLVLEDYAGAALALDDSLPVVPIQFDDVPGRIVCWDDSLFSELRRRGAKFDDFGPALDRFIDLLPSQTDADAQAGVSRVQRYWFEREPDPARRARLLAVLRRTHPSAAGLLGR